MKGVIETTLENVDTKAPSSVLNDIVANPVITSAMWDMRHVIESIIVHGIHDYEMDQPAPELFHVVLCDNEELVITQSDPLAFIVDNIDESLTFAPGAPLITLNIASVFKDASSVSPQNILREVIITAWEDWGKFLPKRHRATLDGIHAERMVDIAFWEMMDCLHERGVYCPDPQQSMDEFYSNGDILSRTADELCPEFVAMALTFYQIIKSPGKYSIKNVTYDQAPTYFHTCIMDAGTGKFRTDLFPPMRPIMDGAFLIVPIVKYKDFGDNESHDLCEPSKDCFKTVRPDKDQDHGMDHASNGILKRVEVWPWEQWRDRLSPGGKGRIARQCTQLALHARLMSEGRSISRV